MPLSGEIYISPKLVHAKNIILSGFYRADDSYEVNSSRNICRLVDALRSAVKVKTHNEVKESVLIFKYEVSSKPSSKV